MPTEFPPLIHFASRSVSQWDGLFCLEGRIVGRHDLSYRSLFSFPRMVKELVCEFVEESWVEKLDFSTLKRVNASYVSPKLKGREGDLVWKLRLRNGDPVFVYILIEHQSRVDRFMAVRLMTYIGLLYQDLLKNGELTPDGLLPLVIPLVLYNGEAQWWAPEELSELIERVDEASEVYVPRLRYQVIDESQYPLKDLAARKSVAAQVFWLEKSRKSEALRRGADRLVPLLDGPEDGPTSPSRGDVDRPCPDPPPPAQAYPGGSGAGGVQDHVGKQSR